MSKLDSIAKLDATAQAELVRRREVSAAELIDAAVERIDAMNPLIHAVVTLDASRARERAQGTLAGPLAGVPFLVKDVMAYPGLRFSMGARLFAKNVAAEGSPFTTRIDEAGLLVLGKSATSELGLLGSTETLLEGITHNPWDLTRSASGSSGGAAAAVASGMVPMAHASDGGGSVRIPASVHGLFGLKPSNKRHVATSSVSSDFGDLVADLCVSRTVRDSALFLSIVEARGPGAAFEPTGFVAGPTGRKLRVGVLTTTLMGKEPDPEVRKACEATAKLCAKLGHEVAPCPPPTIDGAAVSDGFFMSAGAALSGLAAMMGSMLGRPLGKLDLEPFTLSLIDAFQKSPGAIERARETFAAATRAYLALFERFDVLLTPTLAIEPWPIGHLAPWRSREELLARTEQAVGYTPIHNIAGSPGMSVPLHWSDAGLPIGSHFAAKPGEERVLLELAYQLEDAQPWRDRWAPCSYPKLFAG